MRGCHKFPHKKCTTWAKEYVLLFSLLPPSGLDRDAERHFKRSLASGLTDLRPPGQIVPVRSHGGRVIVDWQRDRGLARRVSQGQGNSRFFSVSAFFFIHLFFGFFTCATPSQQSIICFSNPPKSLTYFAPELCRMGRKSFWR